MKQCFFFTFQDPKVIDRLCSLCDMYNVDENKVSCEYLAFAKNKRYNAPTLEIIDLFDQDVLQGLKAKIQENFKNHIYDSTTINEIHNDEENDILDCYSTPKRLISFKNLVTYFNKRFEINPKHF